MPRLKLVLTAGAVLLAALVPAAQAQSPVQACPSTDLQGTCAHSLCTQGGPLVSGCDPCVTQICQSDSFCCSTGWDNICVDEVASICGCGCSGASASSGSKSSAR